LSRAERGFSRVAGWAARHARAVLAAALLLAVAAGAGAAATQLPTDAGTSTLVDSDSEAYRATQHVREVFGEEPVVVLAEGDLERLLLSANLGRLLRLEGCLSANPPKGARPIPGPCTELARLRPVQYLAGPATFLNEAVIQVERQLTKLAKTVPPAQLRQFLLAVATRYGVTSVPSLGNPEFIAHVVFDLEKPRATPKARLAYLFPNSRSAQIVIRLRSDLSESERHRALTLIRDVVEETTPRAACRFHGKPAPCFQLHGGRYVLSGAPVVVDGLTRALRDALLLLLAVAVAVMALTLVLVFRSRLPLLPLALALAAAGITFGGFGLLGGSLTMASIAVLPILIGLAVDYAIQIQARFDEAVVGGLTGRAAATAAAAAGAPTIATACLATAAGFLALLLSPTPMVRSFGLLLVVGVGVAFLLALTAGLAALSLGTERKELRPEGGGSGSAAARGVVFFGHRNREPQATRRKTQRAGRSPALHLQRLSRFAAARPRKVLGVALALAVLGWLAGTQVETVSDIRSLAPQSLTAVRELTELQDATGVSGDLEVSIDAPDLTDPAVIRWMAGFKQRALAAGGFDEEDGCRAGAELCPGPALSDFVGGGRGMSRGEIRTTLAALPPYALEQVAPLDPRTGRLGHTALLAFGIREQSLQDQERLIDRIRAQVGAPGTKDGPPPGVRVRFAGLPLIAAQSAGDLSRSRYWLTLAGLAAVALALLAVLRSARRALAPLAPTVLATGWASLVLWITGIPLNPMSAALGALTIAIATEFSVILSGRFAQERSHGAGVGDALAGAFARTGAAVLASGVTAIAGFAVLIASEVAMLRDFGVVTIVDLCAALAGVYVVLPAALAWLEGGR
jgi:predicted RND superfamily exporter protein